MVPLIALGVGLLCMGLVISVFLYQHITYKWLQYVLTGLVISLPFEQIPSITVGGGTVRISQLLTLVGIIFVLILVAKKDIHVLSTRLNYFFYATLLFFAVSIPSWFFIVDFKRFLLTITPSVIVFLAAIMLSQFLEKPIRALKWLYASLFLACVLGAYQFVGDFIGIPYQYTFLAERYTKIVFGFPRIHATAIEPLYFAGMLFLPIIAFIVYWLSHTDILPFLKINTTLKNISLIIFFTTFFIITISKSAIAILIVLSLSLITFWVIKYPTLKTANDITKLVLGVVIGTSLLVVFVPGIDQWYKIVSEHFIDTFTGKSSTIREREIFLDAGLALLPSNILLGIGSGQFGIAGGHILRHLARQTDGGLYIVNNVYLEVLLEYGIMSFVVFVGAQIATLYKAARFLWVESNFYNTRSKHILIVAVALGANFIQWVSFSPLYVMPIFILLGILINLLTKTDRIYGLE